jgi:uncharacterized membrane protein
VSGWNAICNVDILCSLNVLSRRVLLLRVSVQLAVCRRLAIFFLSQHSDKSELYLRITGTGKVSTKLKTFPLINKMYFSKLGVIIALGSFTLGSSDQPYQRLLACCSHRRI